MTVYILQTAVAKAEAELLDESTFKLPPAEWSAFVEALNRPVKKNARLNKLLTAPSVFVQR